MTIRHLTIFISVCDEGNMTRTAEKLHMTQPSVSQAVKELESHYKVQLFERLGKRLFLTSAGDKLLTYARHLVNLNIQAEEEMRQFGSVYRARLGASVTIGECMLIDLLSRLRAEYPGIQLVSTVHNSAVLENMLLNDALDLALVEGEVHSEYLVARPFMKDALIFIAAKAHPLALKGNISARDLESVDFFLREEGSGTRDLFEKVMQGEGIQCHVAGVYNNVETIKKAVAAGLGISAISHFAVREELAAGKLCRLYVKNLMFERRFRIVHHKNKYLSPALREIMAICNQWEPEV